MATAAAAQIAGPVLAGGVLANDRPETAAKGHLDVSSSAFMANAALPAQFSTEGADRSPPLRWSRAPAAQSYVLIVEDPDAPAPSPHVHWLAWNIPASVAGLPEDIPKTAHVVKAVSMLQGRNSHGSLGYIGPGPPPRDPAHHYHFQIYALDSMLKTPPPGSDRNALLAALRGHVLAKGDLVGTYQQK